MTSSEKKQNLLWVEDDMVPIVHLKQELKASHWQHTIVQTLRESFDQLQRTDVVWDMVLIDLKIPLGSPSQLPPALDALGVLDKNSDVLGRLLGLWLWEQAGRRCRPNGPIHAYLTTVKDRYERVDRFPVEFANNSGKELATTYVLNKWSRQQSLSDALDDLMQRWLNDFPTTHQVQP